MKLLTITNRFNLISILFFLVIAGIILFFFIQYNLRQELDEELNTEKVHIQNSLQSMDSIADPSLIVSDNLLIKKTSIDSIIQPVLFDTLMFDNVDNELIPYRAIRFSAKSKIINYDIIIKKSEIENSDLVISILISMVTVIGFVAIMMIFSSYYFSKRLWSPFFSLISSINKLNLHEKQSGIQTTGTRIEEFRQLNSAIERMIKRIQDDFKRTKEFTENAAHEIQTPLSIISSKLESLLQDSNLNADNAQLISQALENTQRLSRLNQTLLLLTKIENRQFEERVYIEFSGLLKKHLENYEDILKEKEIRVEFHQEGEFVYNIHPVLADILVTNLLNNSIYHNIPKGMIILEVNESGLVFKNTGPDPERPVESFFARFKKGSKEPGHLGLGLALVKEIIDTNNLQVRYEYEKGYHQISLSVL